MTPFPEPPRESAPLDVAVLVPFQSDPGAWVDPTVRAAFSRVRLVGTRARDRLVELLGAEPNETVLGASRSLTAVVLATGLARAGLRFRVLDPGAPSLGAWRTLLRDLARDRPKVVAISSTFVTDWYWLGGMCELVRRTLPGARIVVGGYYYAVNAKQFLSLNVDVLCIGEGEHRIVRIAEAFRDGRSLDGIPGLYLRRPGGRLHHTGDAEPLGFDELPLPDWSLATRIEPPMDPAEDAIEYNVETQRGCVYKCEFCTFRTLAAPVQSSVERAVRAIRATAGYRGTISIVDATATSPYPRWKRVLERLIEEGGAPLPASAYARVSDLDDEICGLMARAGIRNVRIGQESGDQRMLNEMKKGTRVDHIAPAIDALHRHGMTAHFYWMYGFPGETEESMATTRRMIRTLNAAHAASPVVRTTGISVFDIQNFSAVGQRDELRGRYRFGYGETGITPARAAEAVLDTQIELSQIPHAPATAFRVAAELLHMYDARGRDALDHFRWSKAIDRAIGLFAREELEGKRAAPRELAALRDEILASTLPSARMGRIRRSRAQIRHRLTWRVLEKWAKGEPEPGLVTRSAIAWEAARATGRPGDALTALRTGRFPVLGVRPEDGTGDEDGAAANLIQLGMATGRRRAVRG